MTKAQVIEKLKGIIQPYLEDDSIDLSTISEDANFINDLNINSMHLVEVVIDTEEAFDIEITDEEVEQMVTVGATVGLIMEKIGDS